jgi:hypothetical protein
MKQFPDKVIVKVICPKHRFIESLEKQRKKDEGKYLPPKSVRLGPVLGQGPAAKKEILRDKKRDPPGFGCFAAGNGGRKQIDFFYVPGEFPGNAEQHTENQPGKEEKTRIAQAFYRGH